MFPTNKFFLLLVFDVFRFVTLTTRSLHNFAHFSQHAFASGLQIWHWISTQFIRKLKIF